MSDYEEELILKQFEKWDQKHAKRDFIEKMQRKMYKRERAFQHRAR
jgi:hypothetical protein